MIDAETLDVIRRASTTTLTDWWIALQAHLTPAMVDTIGPRRPNDRSALLRLIEATVGQRTLQQAMADRRRDSVTY